MKEVLKGFELGLEKEAQGMMNNPFQHSPMSYNKGLMAGLAMPFNMQMAQDAGKQIKGKVKSFLGKLKGK
jgi:hypothetical protein